MTNVKYNGWTNWETWNAHLWLTNDEWTYYAAQKAVMLLDMPNQELMNLVMRLGNRDGINFSKVNWPEIVNALKLS